MDLFELNIRSAQNNRCSNDRLYRAVLALKPGEFEAERVSFFPSIRATLNHILAVDLYYLDALVEGGVGSSHFDAYVDFDDPTRLAVAQAEQDDALIAFCRPLGTVDLDRRVITDRRQDGQI